MRDALRPASGGAGRAPPAFPMPGSGAAQSFNSNYHAAMPDKNWLIIALCSNISP